MRFFKLVVFLFLFAKNFTTLYSGEENSQIVDKSIKKGNRLPFSKNVFLNIDITNNRFRVFFTDQKDDVIQPPGIEKMTIRFVYQGSAEEVFSRMSLGGKYFTGERIIHPPHNGIVWLIINDEPFNSIVI